MAELGQAERKWLSDYRKVLSERFPGLVKSLTVFGSKARGDARADSDLDVLVLIRAGDWRLKDEIRLPGYDLSIGTEVVPSILVYTDAEWDGLRHRESVFQEVVEREGVAVS